MSSPSLQPAEALQHELPNVGVRFSDPEVTAFLQFRYAAQVEFSKQMQPQQKLSKLRPTYRFLSTRDELSAETAAGLRTIAVPCGFATIGDKYVCFLTFTAKLRLMIMKSFDDEPGSEDVAPFAPEFSNLRELPQNSPSASRPRWRLDEAFAGEEDESNLPSLPGYHMRLAAMNNDILMRRESHRG